MSSSIRRIYSFFLFIFLIVLVLPLAAQTDNDPHDDDEDHIPIIIMDTFIPDLYRAGDMKIGLAIGLLIPTIFTGPGMEGNSANINLGGMGSLSYSIFINPNWFVGGELGGTFLGTRSRNMLFVVSIGPFAGYQFVFGRFELPVRLLAGYARHMYIGGGYSGYIIKPGASLFFRYNPDWSFGLNAHWWMLPQNPKNGRNVLGNFLEVSLSARYHF